SFEGVKGCVDVVGRVDRLPDVVEQRGYQELLVVGPLLPRQLEDLQAVKECVSQPTRADSRLGSIRTFAWQGVGVYRRGGRFDSRDPPSLSIESGDLIQGFFRPSPDLRIGVLERQAQRRRRGARERADPGQ